MTFDIIEITDEEVEKLSTVQLKLLRTAQQKKNELAHKLGVQLDEYKALLYTDGVNISSLYAQYKAEADAEYNRQVEILREQLVFNMSLGEPTSDGETGEPPPEDTGYVVDYELGYLERYILVRDYYLSIPDPNERVALYTADEVAAKYLGRTYYNYLFDYLMQFTRES